MVAMTATARKTPRQQHATSLRSARPAVHERYRALRARLEALPSTTAGGPQVILLASPDTCMADAATSVALAFADAGQRTLLIDGSDAITAIPESLNGAGQGVDDLMVWIQAKNSRAAPELTDSLPMLSRLPLVRSGGDGDPITPALFHRLFGWARQELDRMIVVAPPMSISADALLLARWSDGIVIGVRPGRTARGLVVRARDDLTRAGGIVIGSICLD